MERKIEIFIAVNVVTLMVLQRGAAFDYFQLVQQWPPAYCRTNPSTCNAAVATATNRFTIHGFWPENNDGTILEYCDNASVLTRAQIQTQEANLNTEWPSLENGWTNFDLWKHEWKMHGTCSLPRFNPTQYFQSALDLKMNPTYNIYRILDNQRPSLAPTNHATGQVTTLQLSNAIYSALGYLPEFRCQRDPNTNQWLITEIVLCFEPRGLAIGLQDCPESIGKCLPGHRYFWNSLRSSSSEALLGSSPFVDIRHFPAAATNSCVLLLIAIASSFLYFIRQKLWKIFHCMSAAKGPTKQE